MSRLESVQQNPILRHLGVRLIIGLFLFSCMMTSCYFNPVYEGPDISKVTVTLTNADDAVTIKVNAFNDNDSLAFFENPNPDSRQLSFKLPMNKEWEFIFEGYVYVLENEKLKKRYEGRLSKTKIEKKEQELPSVSLQKKD
ncbi:MAG: hypothetical protein JW795_14490 [Chitinivibrionales bacterium]|nr:hypothetical protein [Chitinivibrionales bacterium]